MAKTNGKGGKVATNPRAARVGVSQLVVVSAYEKTFSTGKRGFIGQVLDPATGQKYQVIGAVEIGG